MNQRAVWALIALVVIATRLCHLKIVWVEEGYPTAAAIQILAGKTIYKDFWFDKPPLFPAVYLLWGARTGLALRIASALYVLLAAWVTAKFARALWGERESLLAAALMAFALTFWIPSAVLVLGPDMLMIVPHVLAVFWAWRGEGAKAGLACGVALALNAKAVFLLPVCSAFLMPQLFAFAAAFGGCCAVWLGALTAMGALDGWWRQVWEWGFLYSANTFATSEGFTRTASWAGFHATFLVGAAIWFWREREWRFVIWFAISLAAVCAGWRFFPRYYFQLLPVATLLGARGLMLIPRSTWRLAAMAFLLIPFARFGPRYLQLAADQVAHRPHDWRDLAMSNDTAAAARAMKTATGDTLLVWGYRPDLFALTGLRTGTPFLDSQPLTGVIADRHLTSTRSVAPELARRNRSLLLGTSPTWIADGLGPYNPALAIDQYEDLRVWLRHYQIAGRTDGFILYRRSETSPQP